MSTCRSLPACSPARRRGSDARNPMTELLLSLVVFAVIATASPGGATTLATASGMRFGLTRSLPLLFGIAVGLASLVGIVAGGLGSLVMSWPALQVWLRLF